MTHSTCMCMDVSSTKLNIFIEYTQDLQKGALRLHARRVVRSPSNLWRLVCCVVRVSLPSFIKGVRGADDVPVVGKFCLRHNRKPCRSEHSGQNTTLHRKEKNKKTHTTSRHAGPSKLHLPALRATGMKQRRKNELRHPCFLPCSTASTRP